MLPGDDYRLKTLGAFDNIDLHRQRLQNGLYNQYMKNCLMVNNGNGEFFGVGELQWCGSHRLELGRTFF